MGRIIVFIAGIFVLAVIIFTVYTVGGIVAERVKENKNRKKEVAERISAEAAKRAELGNMGKEATQAQEHEVDLTECPRCNKRSYCRKYQDYLAAMAEEQTWFSVLYPTLSNDDGHAVSDAVANLIDAASKDVIARKTASKLPKSYRDKLDQIAERMGQIRDRSDNSSIDNVLASYCDSIEKSTLSYVELLDAPVQSDAMRKTMTEIENAIGEVPSTLDAILASTYENDSMKALIEAGALRAVIEHNRTMFGGDGNFVADEVAQLFGADVPVEEDDLDAENVDATDDGAGGNSRSKPFAWKSTTSREDEFRKMREQNQSGEGVRIDYV